MNNRFLERKPVSPGIHKKSYRVINVKISKMLVFFKSDLKTDSLITFGFHECCAVYSAYMFIRQKSN